MEPEQINVRDDLVFNNVESLGDDVIDLDMTRTAMRMHGGAWMLLGERRLALPFWSFSDFHVLSFCLSFNNLLDDFLLSLWDCSLADDC